MHVRRWVAVALTAGVVAVGLGSPGFAASPLLVTATTSTEGAPTGVVASPLTGALRVSWHPPAIPPGATLASYDVRTTGGVEVSAPASAKSVTVKGVPAGRWYAVTVTAVYSDGSRVASLRSLPAATPLLSGWTTKVTGGKTGKSITDEVRVRPAGTWTLQLERRRLDATSWVEDATTVTNASGSAKLKLAPRNGSWLWRVRVVGQTNQNRVGSTALSASRGIVASTHDCVWATSGILTAPAKSGTGKRIIWDKSASQVWLVGKGGTVRCSYAVTDNDEDTPVGTYQVRSKSVMSSAYTDGRNWRLGHMTRFYLQPGHHLWIGFHAVPQSASGQWIQPLSSLGKPGYRSHGCVREHPTNAANLFDFAPVGTKVVVIA